jgi:UDP-glucose 4-epimerase
VLVTGGAGFIGANLVRVLLEQGMSTVVLDDFSTGYRSNLEGVNTEIVEGSILDRDALDRAFDQVDAVVHLAGRPSVPRSLEDPMATNRSNVTGTLEVLEAVRRHGPPHIIVASSSSVYGRNPVLPKHEDLVAMPANPYATSKLATEQYALAYASSFGLDVLALRFFNVYGPLQAAGHAYAAVIPAFVSAALAGQSVTVHGDGEQTRDFTNVGSVARVLADAIDRRVTAPGPVNLAFGERTSLLALLAELEDILGRPIERRHVEPRVGDVRDSQAANGRLLALFPDARAVPFRDGLEATIEWTRGLITAGSPAAAQ